jgi:pyruvate dehydrogenase E1 component alpha subunit
MPKETIAKFEIQYLQILDENGKADAKLEPKLTTAQLKELFRLMILERTFDETALNMQREGRIGTYAQSLGEEACHVGPAFAMKKEDWLVPSYREHGAYFARGVPMKNLFIHWGGSEDGNKMPEDQRNLTVCIPIATQLLHAAGIAWAAKLRKEKNAVLTFFGDGGTSEGDFHEGMNFAGVFELPVVFICRNNEYAISVPRTCHDTAGCQTRAQTLAQKAVSYGFEGIVVDGNDVLACYVATKQALEKAYAGKGPTMIEALTYRMGAHTTADDPARYRNQKETEHWKKKDPIDRFRKYLKHKKIWTAAWEREIAADCRKEVETAIKVYEKHLPKPEDMFTNVFAVMPQHLKEQMDYLARFRKWPR